MADEPAAPESLQQYTASNLASLWHKAVNLEEEQQFEAALRHFNRVLEVAPEAKGDQRFVIAAALEWKSSCHEELGQLEDAIRARGDVLQIQVQRFGEDHWEVHDARRRFADIKMRASWTAEQRKSRQIANALRDQANQAFNGGQYEVAIATWQKAIAIRVELLGEKHPEVAEHLLALALAQRRFGLNVPAEKNARKALDICESMLGENHPVTGKAVWGLGACLEERRTFAQAIQFFDRGLQICQRTHGNEPNEIAGVLLDSLAGCQEALGNYVSAEANYRQSLSVAIALHGKDSVEAATVMQNIGHLYRTKEEPIKAKPWLNRALEIKQPILGERHPDTAVTMMNLGSVLGELGEIEEAERLLHRAFDCQRASLGADHRSTLTTKSEISDLYMHSYRFDRSESILQEVCEKSRQSLGHDDGLTLHAMNRLAELYRESGRYTKARSLFMQVLGVAENSRDKDAHILALVLNNLGLLDSEEGHLVSAERQFQKALHIRQSTLGASHPATATTLHNLAIFYLEIGDFAKAVSTSQEATAILSKKLGMHNSRTIRSLTTLAAAYHENGEFDEAQEVYRRALAESRVGLGNEHPDTAVVLHNLASFLNDVGDYAQAESLMREALQIRRDVLGATHPSTLHSLGNLGSALYRMGKHDAAASCSKQALALKEKVYGKSHPNVATALANVAGHYGMQGEIEQAADYYRRAIDIKRRQLDHTFDVLSERQQLTMTLSFRSTLDAYLSFAVTVPEQRAAPYQHVLAWKGALFARQRTLGDLRQHPNLRDTFERLDRIRQELASFAFAVPGPKQQATWTKEVERLEKEQDLLERELNEKSEDFRKTRNPVSPEDLAKTLPADTVLLDFLEYSHLTPPARGEQGGARREQRLLVFVVRPGEAVICVELGPVSPIADALKAWRNNIFQSGGRGLSLRPPSQQRLEQRPHFELRRLVWTPVEKYLSNVKTILISPDGAIASLPFGCLPGSRDGSYLLEKFTFAVIPVPQLLSDVIQDRPLLTDGPSLFAIGGVDFSAPPQDSNSSRRAPFAEGVQNPASRSAPRAADMQFTQLPGTEQEIVAIGGLFRERFKTAPMLELRGPSATESAFRQGATIHRHMHIATHGFFAPEREKKVGRRRPSSDESKAPKFHPGLLSGLALAGANRGATDAQIDDGILTALELSGLNLSKVEVAVLSACETGLGKSATGEGVLGLQRALQVAGAKTTITSLWKVDDAATVVLMSEFYRNLWDKKLNKSEALRQAQLTMLDRYDPVARRLGKSVASGKQTSGSASPRTAPYYWGAFVLGGNWR